MQKVIGWGKTVVYMVWLIVWWKTQPTLPCHELTCYLCFLGGWGKTGPAHSFPTLTRLNINLMVKVITWGKTVVHMVNRVGKNSASLKIDTFTSQGGERLGGWPSFSPPPNKQRLYVYSWQGKVDAFTCQGGKITDQLCFSPLRYPSFCTRLILTLVRVGKEWAGPVFPHPLISKGCMCIHDRVRLMPSLVRVGKWRTSRVFLYPDNHLHQVDALSCRGGERMGRPSFSPPPNKQRLFAYSWQGKVDAFTCQGGKVTDQPSFSPPR